MNEPTAEAANPDLAHAVAQVDDLLVRVSVLRRQPWYRQLLVEGTGLDGRVGTMRVLRAIDQLSRSHEPGPSIRQVAERLVMEHSTASRAVDQAADVGLVDKSQSSEDGRRIVLSLTDRGLRAITELDARRNALYADLVGSWPGEDLNVLIQLLGRLVDAYEERGS